MTGGNRGRLMLIALGAPPARLSPDVAAVWIEITAVVPLPLITGDASSIEIMAKLVHSWRAGADTRNDLREAYRWLGTYFMPMPARRRLLFPTQGK